MPRLLAIGVVALASCSQGPPEKLVGSPGGSAHLEATLTVNAFEGADAYVEVRNSTSVVSRVLADTAKAPTYIALMAFAPGHYTVRSWSRLCPSTGCGPAHRSRSPRSTICQADVDLVANMLTTVDFSPGCQHVIGTDTPPISR